ncbi:Flp pilus polar localization response receiver ATPase TadZ, FlhG domain-containing [Citrifermentans bemidjiense Bem]|uniref:Flp pilus polar localization response receiver ATPase TadZ, FlhG domain-containing n=1 Tax=Citrifermentans bemidjiense (strain ATCC BAA-1014 / DSM 16622 / JCM 12645 / Bem) TaxID=404380 RepID=B5EAY8_CITBB|nr:AAA family ATPase [Citrifermentans bemidjiense]ACH38849.1 Flp pilus polar localization response receiver ATPase TadZ, FlhG domain-containing [Citrifermentans bemidjiense Bem]
MKQQITAFLIDSDTASASKINSTLMSMEGEARLLGAARNLQEGMQAIQASNPNIVILEVNDLERGTKETELLLSRCPQSAAFISSAAMSPEWILKLIRAGASEYLSRPILAAELIDAVNKVARRRTVKHAPNTGTVFSVYHPSGGVGTTTIAVNLAAMLSAQGHSTALVDLNLYSGDVSAFLDLTPRYTLADVMPKAGQIDASFLKSVIAPHPSGVHVLDCPGHVAETNRITTELLQEVIDVLRTIFEYTVIDTGGELFGCNLATFNLSNRILFATVLTVPCLRTAKRYLTAMADVGLGPDRVKLVVNRYLPRDDIRISDAEKVLRTKAYHMLPNNYTDHKTSVNKGVPLALYLTRSSFSKSMDQLARQLCQDSTR